MAKQQPDEVHMEDDAAPVAVVEAAPPAPPVPFEVPPKQNPPPTEAQHNWLRDHPVHMRISHAVLGRFTLRGTLTPEGDFIPDTKMPVHDGNGSFGVGVPSSR